MPARANAAQVQDQWEGHCLVRLQRDRQARASLSIEVNLRAVNTDHRPACQRGLRLVRQLERHRRIAGEILEPKVGLLRREGPFARSFQGHLYWKPRSDFLRVG